MAKILIVDDSEILRHELRSLLEGAGHQVVEGANGALGLKAAKENAGIELVITDLNMPEMDGVTMCKQLKSVPGFEKIPFFMLTTENSPELKSAGKDAGIILWIVKPFVGDKVLAAITKVLAMSKAA